MGRGDDAVGLGFRLALGILDALVGALLRLRHQLVGALARLLEQDVRLLLRVGER